MLKTIPPLAWIVTSAGGLILATGVAISTVKSSSLKVEFANFKLDSTARLSRVLELSKELEKKTDALQAQQEAYSRLKAEYEDLKRYDRPISSLEPAIQELERVKGETDLDELEDSIEAATKEVSEEIADLSEPESTIPDQRKN